MSQNFLAHSPHQHRLLEGDHDHEGEGSHEESSVLTLKIVVIFLVAICALMVFLPYMKCIKNKKEKKKVDDGDYNNARYICCGGGRVQSYSTAFASGMLMTMALCHILPETVTSYENVMKAKPGEDDHDHRRLLSGEGEVKEEEHGGKFPAAYILVLVGFWIMQFLDQVAFKKVDEGNHGKEEKDQNIEQVKPQITAPDTAPGKINQVDQQKENGQKSEVDQIIAEQQNDKKEDGAEPASANDVTNRNLQVEEQKAEDNPEEPFIQRVSNESLATFGLAVCLHSTIDGLAIGVFNQSSLIFMLALSVIIHKIPLAFTIGATFESQRPNLDKPTLGFFILFILTTPIGILIGMAIGASSSMVLVVIQGISGGVFIYLAMCDLLIHEFHESHDLPDLDMAKKDDLVHKANRKSTQLKISLSKFFFQLIGAAMVVTLVSVSPEHSH